MTSQLLVAAGGLIFLVLGALHFLYTFLDLSDPRRFAPADPELLERLKTTRIGLRSIPRDFWTAYLGFHFSHSVGLIFIGGTIISISFGAPMLLQIPFVAIGLISIGVAYAVMSHFFWFSIPLIGSLLGTGLIIAGIWSGA